MFPFSKKQHIEECDHCYDIREVREWGDSKVCLVCYGLLEKAHQDDYGQIMADTFKDFNNIFSKRN